MNTDDIIARDITAIQNDIAVQDITEPETRINIAYILGDGYESHITLVDDDLTAFSTGNRGHFLEGLEENKNTYERIYQELSTFVGNLATPGSCDEDSAEKVKELVDELNWVVEDMVHNSVALKAMDGKFKS